MKVVGRISISIGIGIVVFLLRLSFTSTPTNNEGPVKTIHDPCVGYSVTTLSSTTVVLLELE